MNETPIEKVAKLAAASAIDAHGRDWALLPDAATAWEFIVEQVLPETGDIDLADLPDTMPAEFIPEYEKHLRCLMGGCQ